jgi:hypothetical protein
MYSPISLFIGQLDYIKSGPPFGKRIITEQAVSFLFFYIHALILGTILLIAGIYFAYTGYRDQQNLNNSIGQFAHSLTGTTQQAQNNATLELFSGTGGSVLGLIQLLFSEKKMIDNFKILLLTSHCVWPGREGIRVPLASL